ncbi:MULTISPECIES: hypothetical protein [Methylomicrobium]|uniref:Uncharacterized protein n=1 Tax=Methylomicrobium album BG8 TaxID=686340 RepID=H8GK85_METAL|nr:MULTISPECIES: hypothetical protein [Methylomicrobium]EIC29209.1 hypothetical protein Metal_1424 [Methylomicrobium album BG8]
MYTLYKINSDDLNENFIAAIKAQFPHQTIEIAISEVTQVAQDETAYLLSNPENKERLLAAIEQIESNRLIDIDLEKL